jgi:hypothetical protein
VPTAAAAANANTATNDATAATFAIAANTANIAPTTTFTIAASTAKAALHGRVVFFAAGRGGRLEGTVDVPKNSKQGLFFARPTGGIPPSPTTPFAPLALLSFALLPLLLLLLLLFFLQCAVSIVGRTTIAQTSRGQPKPFLYVADTRKLAALHAPLERLKECVQPRQNHLLNFCWRHRA